jgi:hypothetical protein
MVTMTRDPDDDSLYCTSMLALLRPWRSIQGLKAEDKTWHVAFETFITTSDKQTISIISKAQFYY